MGTVDVFLIHQETNVIIKRWESVQTSFGVVSLSYLINDAPPPGSWQIKAVAMGHEAVKHFEVIEFYQWKHEVNVSMPHYILTTAPTVSGTVVAK